MNRREALKYTLAATASVGLFQSARADEPKPEVEANGRWTVERAQAWGKKQGWIVGCNYVPTYAVNQIEMWQKLTFDPQVIDSELGLVEQTGMNTVRVFVHDLLWRDQRDDFFGNVGKFFDLCEKHGLRVIFNFFTNGGAEGSVIGPQPAPKPFVHNSQWRQTPGKEAVINKPEKWSMMEDYVMDTMTTFRSDERILFWDLFNEPANSGNREMTLGFLKLLWSWARKIDTPFPMTSAIQSTRPAPIANFLIENSDVLSFHCYANLEGMKKDVERYQKYNRPLICKEWMARQRHSTVMDILPYLKEQNVGAINWGLIPGKLQTNYPWGWGPEKGEPDVWFHDLYREDHTPYDPKEIELFQKLTGKVRE